ncbi:MAG: DNA polymerase I [Gammaproteobacteria bacterium]
MADQKPFVLVDGSSYLFRAFYALPPLTTSSGEPTGAVLGVTNMLLKLIQEYDPEHVAVVFDAGGKTFRDELFEEYKAHRPPMPDELRAQVPALLDIVPALGLPLLRIEGVEADDVIGTLVQKAKADDMPSLISTGDKDMAQLVEDDVTLVNTMTNRVMNRDGVKEKFDVTPEQIIDYLALVGDTSDNIPGVPKVGPKTAAMWLNKYGTLDEIVAHADEITGKVGESLRENLEQLELSRKLATIHCDVDLETGIGDLKRREPDVEKLREIYTRLELKSLLRQLPGNGTEPALAKTDSNYETIFKKTDFERWRKKIKKASLFAFDTETTSLDYMQARIVGVSLAVVPGEAAYIPLAHDYHGAPDQLGRDVVLEGLRPILEDDKRSKVGHHLKYDAHVLANHGITLRGMKYDSMLESYVLNSTAVRHDMDSVAEKYLGRKTIHYEDVAGKGAKQLTFNEIPLEQAAPYAAEDADVTLQLHQALWSQLEKLPGLRKLYEEIEQPLVPVLIDMEHTGVLIDTDMLESQSREIEKKLVRLEKEAFEESGQPFNLGSPKQLQEILFEKLGLPIVRKTPKGQPSTAEDVMQELAADYELPRIILEHRGLSKLKSTYTDKLPEQLDPDTGRVHTSYHQAVAATGRLSSSDPNLQNIPVRTTEGRRIRQAFIAPEGCRLLAADYSQIELRIMAHLSGDKGLLDAFAKDLDIHRATAAEVFGVALDDVSSEQRRSAKAINFGLIYGMSAFGLARQLGIGRSDAQEYVDLYFERYPDVKAFMQHTRQQAHEKGFVETVFKRRLYLPEINSRNVQRRQYAERSAINAPMQGTAADIIKLAMINLHRWLSGSKVDARIIMQVHDELVFEAADKDLATLENEVVARMTGAAKLKVPLKVDVGVGSNWDEAH